MQRMRSRRRQQLLQQRKWKASEEDNTQKLLSQETQQEPEQVQQSQSTMDESLESDWYYDSDLKASVRRRPEDGAGRSDQRVMEQGWKDPLL